jgi:autotransporter adhesin
MGQRAQASGPDAIAIGRGAAATGSVAVGAGTQAASGGAAFGDNAVATGAGAAALGPNAAATADNAVAIGNGSIADQAGTVSVGAAGSERRITNVAAGIAPTDAVNVAQFQSGMSDLSNRIDQVSTEARRGIAAAAAMAPIITPSAPGRTTFTLNSSFYRSQVGVGVGFAHRFDTRIPLIVHGSYANGGGSEHIGRVGMAVEF